NVNVVDLSYLVSEICGELPWVQRDRLGAVVRLVDPDQTVGQFEHVVPQRDNDELSILLSHLDVVGYDGNILEVEGGIDLVHDVERGGLVVVQGKH
ncbi:hypothetical protein EGW08_008802, partial [Elysia chlorotica]